jgi:hypothetical protein
MSIAMTRGRALLPVPATGRAVAVKLDSVTDDFKAGPFFRCSKAIQGLVGQVFNLPAAQADEMVMQRDIPIEP